MSLKREATQTFPGFRYGDIKIAHYPITYTAHAITKPSQDPNWMLLNGAVLSQTAYPILFAKFGSAYNTGGEGTGNFRLPDLTEGKVPIGKGLGTFTTVGVSGGEISHVVTVAEMPSHAHSHTFAWASTAHGHSMSASLGAADSHSHGSLANAVAGPDSHVQGGSASAPTASGTETASTSSGNGHTHGMSFSIGNATSSVSLSGGVSNTSSGGGSHNNMQPYMVIGGWLVMFG